jgi:UDP-N-acetylmuramate dehydrogenase
VEDVTELVTAVTLARQYRIPVFILGGGANLLIRDEGIRGLVVENRAGRVNFPPVIEMGLSGLEWAVGVPGTIGGAVVNNAGAYGRDMARSLIRAELLSPGGERSWQPVEWFEYGYRTSRLKQLPHDTGAGGWVVLQVEL